MPRPHGTVRGFDSVLKSRNFEGRFGRMFRNLPAAGFDPRDLLELGATMISAKTEDSNVPAGYAYFGQFLGHDITFDPASSLQHDNDPDALVDFRTPRFDLDSVYGRGPVDQPYLYEKDDSCFLLGDLLDNNEDVDVPRAATERAIIADPRNDENVIVSQLHAIFLRFHNRMVEENPDADFSGVQQLVRWHYQWVVLYDFLLTIVN